MKRKELRPRRCSYVGSLDARSLDDVRELARYFSSIAVAEARSWSSTRRRVCLLLFGASLMFWQQVADAYLWRYPRALIVVTAAIETLIGCILLITVIVAWRT